MGERKPPPAHPTHTLWAGVFQGRAPGTANVPVFILLLYLKTSRFTSWEEAKARQNLYAVPPQLHCRQNCPCFWKCAFYKSNVPTYKDVPKYRFWKCNRGSSWTLLLVDMAERAQTGVSRASCLWLPWSIYKKENVILFYYVA